MEQLWQKNLRSTRIGVPRYEISRSKIERDEDSFAILLLGAADGIFPQAIKNFLSMAYLPQIE